MTSAIQAARAGVAAFTRQLGVTARNVANASSPPRRVQFVEQSPSGVSLQRVREPDGATAGVDLTTELPELLVGVRGVEVNLKTLTTQDDMLGTLLDLLG